jgi:aspartate-semialdehyde dehydrogenase
MSNLKYKVAIVGATGLVGHAMLKCIEELIPEVNSNDVVLVASDKNHSPMNFRSVPKDVISLSQFLEQEIFVDIVLLSAGEEVSKQITPRLAKKGVWVIDNSTAYREEKAIPLTLPWIRWRPSSNQKIIPVPNCVTAMIATVLAPLMKLKPTMVSATVMQSVSGAGQAGVDAMNFEIAENMQDPGSPFMFQAVNNVQSSAQAHKKEKHFNIEEHKVLTELPKILGEPINISPRCFRIPVYEAHTADIVIEFPREVTYARISGALRMAPNVVFKSQQCGSRDVIGRNYALVWNLVRTNLHSNSTHHSFVFTVASDNLRLGTAFPAVMAMKKIVDKFFV